LLARRILILEIFPGVDYLPLSCMLFQFPERQKNSIQNTNTIFPNKIEKENMIAGDIQIDFNQIQLK
jgi:hypothetical protein